MNLTDRLSYRVEILDAVLGAKDARGKTLKTWSVVAAVAASRRDVSDGERVQNAALEGVRSARFVIRRSNVTKDLGLDQMLRHDGQDWEIVAIKEPPNVRRMYLEITAKVPR